MEWIHRPNNNEGALHADGLVPKNSIAPSENAVMLGTYSRQSNARPLIKQLTTLDAAKNNAASGSADGEAIVIRPQDKRHR